MENQKPVSAITAIRNLIYRIKKDPEKYKPVFMGVGKAILIIGLFFGVIMTIITIRDYDFEQNAIEVDSKIIKSLGDKRGGVSWALLEYVENGTDTLLFMAYRNRNSGMKGKWKDNYKVQYIPKEKYTIWNQEGNPQVGERIKSIFEVVLFVFGFLFFGLGLIFIIIGSKSS